MFALKPEKVHLRVSSLSLCTTLCQRNQASYDANIQSAGFNSGVGLGKIILNMDHNNGLACIIAPQGIGTKRKLMCSELLHKGENERLGKGRVRFLGTVLLPADCATSLSQYVLPSQVFF